MYKYFKELENPNDFKVYLSEDELFRKRRIYNRRAWESNEFFTQYNDVFKRINIIDMLIKGTHEQLLLKHPVLNFDIQDFELANHIHEFSILKSEEKSYFLDFFKDEIKIIDNDLYKYLNIYRHFCILLNEIYPEFKYFISETLNKIKDLLKELRAKSEIQLPSLPPEHIYVFPNAWFITPNGYLYNTGGPDGHQNGNLHNSFIFACNRIKLGLPIPKKIGCYEQIKSIEAREYITYEEYNNYTNNLWWISPVIDSRCIIDEKDRFAYRMYQKNPIKLIIGHLAALESFSSSFARLNNSKNKKEILEKLLDITNKELADVLVRYSGFHKIESVVDKTITTSSLKGIENFKEYLDRGWNLHIIPGIVYDKTRDELTEVDFNSCFVQKYLDKELSNYNGKGKILIKK